jgi:TP901 family phage tail tape measure protein
MKKISGIDFIDKDPFADLNASTDAAIKKSNEYSNALKKEIKLMRDLAAAAGSTAKSYAQIEAANRKQKAALTEKEKIDKKILETQKRLTEVTDKQRQALESLRLEEQRRNKEAREAARLNSQSTGAFEKLTIKIKQLSDQYRNLIAQEGRETAQSRQLREEILALNRVRDSANEALGMHQNRVGQYGQAIGKLTKLLGQLGLAFGVFNLLRDSFTILTDFDEKLADIAKTTGLSTEAASELSLELLNINTRTSVTELQQLASAAGRLGIEGKANIISFVEAADKVFVALGDDLEGTAEEIATSLGKISSQFGLEAEFGVGGGIERVGSVMNELAANSKASAGAIFDFTNRMAGLASVAGIAQEDVQALGALFDSTGQSIEVAATTLNTLLPALSEDQERFAAVAGMTADGFGRMLKDAPIEALKAVAVGAQSSEGGLDGLVATLGDFGVESARAAGIVGVLASNTDELTRLQNLANTALRENTSITDEFNIKNDTLNAAVEKLRKAWDKLVIKWSEGSGVGEKLKNVIKFLADNLETIVNVVLTGVKAWASYKLALTLYRKEVDATGQSVAVGLIPSILNIGKSMLEAARGVNRAALSMRGLGAAIKTIPFAALVSFLVTVLPMLYDFVSGLFESAEASSALGKATEEANKQIIEEKAQMETLFQQLKRTNAGSSERKVLIDKINETYGTTLQNLSDETAFADQLSIAYEKVNAQLERKIRTQVFQDSLTELITKELQIEAQIEDLIYKRDNRKRNQRSYADDQKAIQAYNDDINELRKDIVKLNIEKDEVFNKIKGLGANVAMGKAVGGRKEPLTRTEDTTETTLKGILNSEKSKEDELAAYKKKLATELLEYENDLILQGADREQIDDLVATKKLAQARKYSEKIISLNFENNDILIAAENDRLKQFEDLQIDYIDASKRNSDGKTDNDLNNLKKYGKAIQQVFEDEITHTKKLEEAKLKMWKKVRDSVADLNNLVEIGLQSRVKALDTEIEKQTRLYDESKTREQELIEIAKEKNLNADESIKLERDKQKAALQEKQKLEAKQRQLEALIAFLNAYAAKIQAGEGNPVANIKKDILSAKSFVEGNFYKGTDTTIGDSLGYNGIKDGHIVAIDDNEAILNPTLTREMGIGRGRTTQDVADIVKLFDITANKSMKVSDKSVNLTNGFDSKAIKLLEKLAQNTQPSAQPTGKNEFDVITGVLTYTANSKMKKETIKYKVRS